MTNRAHHYIEWLTQWYAAQCDGDWEHTYGVKIDTLDNPGWIVKIDLCDTELAGKAFEPLASGIDTPDGDPSQHWHHCKVEDDCFVGAGGVSDLPTILGVFRRWVETTANG